MNGVLIEFFWGVYFTIVGLAELSGTTNDKKPAVVKLIAGIILLLIAFLHVAFV